ncbi:MAG: hypothetical protein ABSE56_02395 [Bryobacteraceae bacterium]|jgi:hypothetical protein
MRVLMAVLGLLVSAVPAAPAAPVQADVLVIEKQPWTGAQPQSPRIAPGRSGVDFALVPATGSRGPTLAFLGAARVPKRFAEVYAGRIEGAVQIVAVDLRTGAMFENHAEPRNAIPLSKALNPDPQPSSSATGNDQIENYFNVDLRVQLGIPTHGAKYAVFVWLDDMVSPVRIAQMPGEPLTGSAPKPVDASAIGVHFGDSAQTPHAGEGIALRSDGSRVYGYVARGARQSMFRVLALDFRTRSLSSLTFALPKKDSAFDLDLSVLAGYDPNATGAQKTFVLVGWGATWSPVLVVERSSQ